MGFDARIHHLACLMVLVMVSVACVPLTPGAAATDAVTPDTGVSPPATATPLPVPQNLVYVLDPRGGELLSQVLAVDLDERRVAFAIQTRYLPEVALSPDGRRLYVADSYRTRVTRGQWRAALSVYDPGNGLLLAGEVPVADRLLYKLYPLPGHPTLFTTTDGSQLYVRKYGPPDDAGALRLAILDAVTLTPLREGPAPPCDHVVEADVNRWLCANVSNPTTSTGLRLDVVDPRSLNVAENVLSLPGWRYAGQATTADNGQLFLLGFTSQATPRSDRGRPLRVLQFDVAMKKVVAETRLNVPLPRLFFSGAVTTPADGSRLYLGVSRERGASRFDQIWVYDTTNWTGVAVLPLPDPALHFALGPGGDRLLVVSPEGRNLVVYDTETLVETAVLDDLGDTPARIVVPRLTLP